MKTNLFQQAGSQLSLHKAPHDSKEEQKTPGSGILQAFPVYTSLLNNFGLNHYGTSQYYEARLYFMQRPGPRILRLPCWFVDITLNGGYKQIKPGDKFPRRVQGAGSVSAHHVAVLLTAVNNFSKFKSHSENKCGNCYLRMTTTQMVACFSFVALRTTKTVSLQNMSPNWALISQEGKH